ncbi:hypothetical protein V1523DRAFT_268471 [Lipomyces doorenjongii]
MSVIGDLDDYGSAARGRQSLRRVAEALTAETESHTETRVAVEKIVHMEQSVVMNVVNARFRRTLK